MKLCLRPLLIAIAVFALALCRLPARAQIVTLRDQERLDADSIRRAHDNGPYFGLYKDNYFTLGTTLGGKPNNANSDVKFQISISQRLTKSTLPWHTYLYLFYSQKAFWNVFQESLPFYDLNFNPGIGWSKLFIVKGKLVGKGSIILEHESNGRDGDASRSWNKISFSGAAFVDQNIMVHARYWIPIVDGKQNKDILKYSGIYQAGIQGITANRRWVFDLTFVKRKGWSLNGNTIINIGYRLFPNANQFLMLHYYNGYGENLLDYNRFHSRLRIGLLIRPTLFSDF